MQNDKTSRCHDDESCGVPVENRKEYSKPQLRVYGSVTDIIKSGSVAVPVDTFSTFAT